MTKIFAHRIRRVLQGIRSKRRKIFPLGVSPLRGLNQSAHRLTWTRNFIALEFQKAESAISPPPGASAHPSCKAANPATDRTSPDEAHPTNAPPLWDCF